MDASAAVTIVGGLGLFLLGATFGTTSTPWLVAII